MGDFVLPLPAIFRLVLLLQFNAMDMIMLQSYHGDHPWSNLHAWRLAYSSMLGIDVAVTKCSLTGI